MVFCKRLFLEKYDLNRWWRDMKGLGRVGGLIWFFNRFWLDIWAGFEKGSLIKDIWESSWPTLLPNVDVIDGWPLNDTRKKSAKLRNHDVLYRSKAKSIISLPQFIKLKNLSKTTKSLYSRQKSNHISLQKPIKNLKWKSSNSKEPQFEDTKK